MHLALLSSLHFIGCRVRIPDF